MKTVKLKEIASITMGQSPESMFYNVDEKGLPFLQGRTTFGRTFPFFDTWTTKWKKEAKPGDLLFTVRAPVGDINIAINRIAIGRGIAAISPRNVSLEYLYYALIFNKNYFLSKSNGSVYDSINIETLENVSFNIHERTEEQNKVVSVLGNYDKLIELNQKHIELLEHEIEEIYKEWFVRTKISKVNLRLEKIMSFDRGISYSSDQIDVIEGKNLINLGNLKAFGGFIKENSKLYDGPYKQNQVVVNGDLVMGVTDMTQDRRTVGSVALLENLEGINVISADLIKIKSKYSNYFLYSLFKFGQISKYISQFANGTNVLHLRPESILKIKVDLPDEILINKYSNYVEPIFEHISTLRRQNENLKLQRDILLPRLMSGELEVK